MTFSRKALLKRFRLTHIIVVLRFVLAVTLLAFLVELGALDFQQFTRIFNIPGTIFTSLVLMGSAVVLSVYRWKILLRLKGIDLSFKVLWHMNYFALFSNNFFPGGAGGDIVRSYYIVKYADKQITKGMLSVGVDRILGLLALMTIAVVFFFYEPFSDTQITPLFQTALIITIVAYIVIVGICLSVIYARSIGLVSLYEAIIEKNSSLWKYSRPFYEALRSYKSSPICLLQCLILSFVSQGLTLLIIVIVSVNMELGDISIRQYALAGASGLLANVLPITPGGIGIGESAFDQVCRLLATNAAGSFSVGFLVFRVVSMMFTIPGIFSYIFLFQNRKTS